MSRQHHEAGCHQALAFASAHSDRTRGGSAPSAARLMRGIRAFTGARADAARSPTMCSTISAFQLCLSTAVLAASSGCATTTAAHGAAVVAVHDIEDPAGRFSPPDLDQLTTLLTTKLAAAQQYRVVPRAQLRQQLQEQKAESYKPCFDESCQIELAKAVSAEKSLSTRIVEVGTKCAITSTLFDLKLETSERAATQKVRCDQDALVTALEAVASELLTGEHSELPESVVGPAGDRGVMQASFAPLVSTETAPGRGRHLGVVPIALWGAGAVAAAVFEIQAREHAANANNPAYVGGQLEVGRATTDQTVAFVSLGVGAVVGIAAWYFSGE